MNHRQHSDPAERRGLLRLFYRNWRPTRLGRWANGFRPSGPASSAAELHGRPQDSWPHTGRRRSNPVVIATVEGKRYLVSMLGPGLIAAEHARYASASWTPPCEAGGRPCQPCSREITGALTVSPLLRRAMTNAVSCAGVASPLRIC